MVWSWDQGQQGYTEDSYAVEVDYNFTQSLVFANPLSSFNFHLAYRTNLICLFILSLLRTNCTLAEVVSTNEATVIQQINWWACHYLG